MNTNLVVLTGTLGRDVESRNTTSGKSVASFSIANDYGFGEKKTTSWFNIQAWDKTAEVAAKGLKKGSRVLVKGRLSTRSYEKNGQKQYVTEVVADSIEFLDKKGLSDAGESVDSELGF